MLSDRDYMGTGGYRRRTVDDGSIVKPLIIANIVVFVLTLLTGGGTVELLVLKGAYIRDLQIWRLGTYMFAHAGGMHILVNMWGLFIFGRPLEQRLGSHRFLSLYFISGIIGGVVWLLFNWDNPYGVVGASGAVFGVMMAAAMTFPNQTIMLLFPPIPMKLKTFVAVFGGLEVLLALDRSGGSGIAHIAHLGGILGGFLYMRRLRRGRGGANSGITGPFMRWWRRWRSDRTRRNFKMTGTGESSDRSDDQTMNAEVDRILDKVGEYGLESLTSEERETLEKARRRFRDKS